MTPCTEKFYVTTPIYYVNDIPHIGHTYSTIAADILARYWRLKGRKVFFLTGTDEHGQKVEKAAIERGRSPKDHADIMGRNFKDLWKKLNISNDAFIRTTDERHKKIVRELLQKLWDAGEIEKRTYCGMYCTPCERFWTEKDLIGGNCPDCERHVECIEESNYFFLMSKYQNNLIKHIERTRFILPETRRNEVLGFLNSQSLSDLCISRPIQRLAWGIPLPFDEQYTTYVWFDALVNYYSATLYLVSEHRTQNTEHRTQNTDKEEQSEYWWPADLHIIGKDILTTHAVYWSTMLMALNLPLPKNIFAHGWWTVQGKKMSKSMGNVVDPNEMIGKYGIDAFRYFLFREVPFGIDGNFSEDALIRRINADLVNDLGNLLSRFLSMAEKYFNGKIEIPVKETTKLNEFVRQCIEINAVAHREDYWSDMHFNLLLEGIWSMIRSTNSYIARTEPWNLAVYNKEELKKVMFHIWNVLRLTAISLYPFMPDTAEKMWKQLGLQVLTVEVRLNRLKSGSYAEIFKWEWKPSYDIKTFKGDQLFPRIRIPVKPK